jgi:hypothetical protein
MLSVLAAVVVVMDPTVKVALIVVVGQLIIGIPTLILGFLNRKGLREIKVDVNSNFTRMMNQRDVQEEKLIMQAGQLGFKTEQLAHAEGRREGIESTEDNK